MMVHFRKRFTPEFIAKVNEYICTGKWSNDNEDDDDDGFVQTPDDLPPGDEVGHNGKLILDATCVPSDIRYPSDVMLLDECRENLEKMTDELWETSGRKGRKVPYTLQQSVMKHYNRFGCYPEIVLADQIYRTRENIKFCKDKNIRLSGSGFTSRNAGQAEKEQAYRDLCDRNAIEGVNGV